MRRTVSAQLELTTLAGATRLVMQLAVARVPGLQVEETLALTIDGDPLQAAEVPTAHGGVIHTVTLPPETTAPKPPATTTPPTTPAPPPPATTPSVPAPTPTPGSTGELPATPLVPEP